MRLHFFTNGIFSTSIAGGDIHFLKLAEGAAKYGYELNFFGGHALQQVIRKHNIPGTVTLRARHHWLRLFCFRHLVLLVR
jgi:hypothetical protein